MFKSTANLRAEQFDRLTEDVGGANNASTGDDVTEYHEVVPSNHLETLLWAEAERMMNLKVDEENFKSERAVVEEEYRQRVLASPYGRLFNAFSSASYLEHPYRAARRSAASRTSNRRSTLSDVVAFHGRRYRPDNATLHRRRRLRSEAARRLDRQVLRPSQLEPGALLPPSTRASRRGRRIAVANVRRPTQPLFGASR